MVMLTEDVTELDFDDEDENASLYPSSPDELEQHAAAAAGRSFREQISLDDVLSPVAEHHILLQVI